MKVPASGRLGGFLRLVNWGNFHTSWQKRRQQLHFIV